MIKESDRVAGVLNGVFDVIDWNIHDDFINGFNDVVDYIIGDDNDGFIGGVELGSRMVNGWHVELNWGGGDGYCYLIFKDEDAVLKRAEELVYKYVFKGGEFRTGLVRWEDGLVDNNEVVSVIVNGIKEVGLAIHLKSKTSVSCIAIVNLGDIDNEWTMSGVRLLLRWGSGVVEASLVDSEGDRKICDYYSVVSAEGARQLVTVLAAYMSIRGR